MGKSGNFPCKQVYCELEFPAWKGGQELYFHLLFSEQRTALPKQRSKPIGQLTLVREQLYSLEKIAEKAAKTALV